MRKYMWMITSSLCVNLATTERVTAMERVLLYCGPIIEPTVIWNKGKLPLYDVFGGGQFGLEYDTVSFKNNNRVGFVRGWKCFYSKLRDIDLYKKNKQIKNDYYNWIIGGQAHIGANILLNRLRNNFLYFDEVMYSIHSVELLVGIKEELSPCIPTDKTKLFPTKIMASMAYVIILNRNMCMKVELAFNRCFSPVYLLPLMWGHIHNVFNRDNNCAWNVNLNVYLGVLYMV